MNPSRYPGSKPFETNQSDIFFGRKQNVNELYRRVLSEPFTVLFSKSGFGKSSLINAGLIPKIIKERSFRPIHIRFLPYTTENPSPLEKTCLRIRSGKTHITTFLDQLIENEKSIWHDLKEQQIKSKDNESILLIFDQFEEFFTYPLDQQLEFRKQLAEGLNTPVPQRYWDILDLYSTNDTPFTKEQLALLQKKLNLSILISIRQDRIHLLENMSDYLPTNSTNWFKLGPLDDISAKAAIEMPAKPVKEIDFKSPPFEYTPESVDYIIEFLNKNHKKQIESSQLQIICSSIEDKVIKSDLEKVTIDDIGDLNLIIKNYYDEKIDSIKDKEERKKARDLIEDDLIFSDGKNQRRLALFDGIILKKIKEETLKTLVDSHLLRSEPVEEGKGFTYELSHDALLKPILDSKEQKEREQKERALADERKKEEERIKQKEIDLHEAKSKIYQQRQRIILISLIASLAIIGLLFGWASWIIAKNSLKKVQETKVNSILNFTKLNLKDDPTLSFRLAEAARKTHGKHKDLKKTIISAYNNSNTLQFYNSFVGHHKEINSIDFNHQENLIITCSDDSTAIIWNLDGSIKYHLKGHQGSINQAKISKDGKFAVTASNDNTAIIWDLENEGKLLKILKGHHNKINAIDVSSKWKHIITVSDDENTIVWDFNGNRIDTLNSRTRYKGEILWVKYNSTEDIVFNYSNDHYIRRWTINENGIYKPLKVPYVTKGGNFPLPFSRSPLNNHTAIINRNSRIQLHRDSGSYTYHSFNNLEIVSLGISENRNTLILTDNKNNITLYDTNHKRKKIIGNHDGMIYSIVFSPSGKYFVTVSDDQTIKLWDHHGVLLQTLKGFTGYNTKVKFSKNGKFLVTASGTELRVWPFKEKKMHILEIHDQQVNTANFSPNDTLVITASDDKNAVIWNIYNDTTEYLPHSKKVTKAQFFPMKNSSSDNLVFTISGKETLVWDYTSTPPKKKGVFKQQKSKINAVCLSSNNSKILLGDTRGRIYEWSNYDKTKINVDRKNQFINIIDTSFQNDNLLSSMSVPHEHSFPQSIYLDTIQNLTYDTSYQMIAHITEPHSFQIASVQYFPDNENKIIFAVNSKSFNSVFIVDKPSYEQDTISDLSILSAHNNIVKLTGHRDKINKIIISNDKKRIATVSNDNTTMVWNVKGDLLFTLRGHTDDVLDADFSPDNKHLATCSKDKSVKIWDISNKKEQHFELLSFSEHNEAVNSVEFSKNNDFILSASSDNTVRVKPINLIVDSIIAEVNNKETFGNIRQLTKEEKEKYGIEENKDDSSFLKLLKQLAL